MKKNIIILGGGVIGLCSAYYLAEEGHRVTLVDKNHPTDNLNCSMGNAGMIVPSHFAPLATPGIIAQGAKWLFKSSSPLYIKPQFNASLASWLYKFWRAANKKQVEAACPVLKEFNAHSLTLYKELDASKKFDFQFQSKGLLMLCKTPEFLEEEIHGAQKANALGLETKILDTEKLKQLEPNIEMDVAGGVLYTGDAHLQPDAFIKELYTYLQNKPNVEFISNCTIKGFESSSNKIKALITQNGTKLEGDEFVLAAGSLSSNLVKGLRLNLPMLPGKGYSMTVKQNGQQLHTPSIFCEARVAITPMQSHIRFGGTMELGTSDTEINTARLNGIINSVNKYFPSYDVTPLRNAKAWSGLRPCSPDGMPYIGRFNSYKNLIAASGHAMMGLSLGPATGEIVASLVAERKTYIDLALFNPDRYQ